MTIPKEQTELLIAMWREDFSSQEICLALRNKLGIYVDCNSVKSRAKKLIGKGVLAPRGKGWNIKIKRLAAVNRRKKVG